MRISQCVAFLEYAIRDKANILQTVITRRSLGGSVREFVLNLCRLPSEIVGPRWIRSVRREGSYWVVQIQGCADELYWPYEDMRLLYAVLSEQMLPWHWHRYQTPETPVQPGDVVVDCGAAEGLFGLLVKSVAHRVYCIEPVEAFQGAMRRTFRNDPHVTVLGTALGEQPGETDIPDYRGGLQRVKVETLDRLRQQLNTPVHYLKGDLEGHEMAVLRGARATITECRPRIAFACYHSGQSAAEMMRFLKSCHPGYRFRLKGISWCRGVREPMILHAW